MNTARFIAFEGGEASGKSTQAARLAERLGALLTREPGGTPIGEQIRAILLDRATSDLDDRAEALLMAAARAQHVASVIRPALDEGRSVVTDRFTGSSLAYQGFGRGLDLDTLRRISWWAARGLEPDVTVLLEVDRVVASARLGVLDRFEAAGVEFHQQVVDGYRQLARADPDHWVVVDGRGTIDDVSEAVWKLVSERLS